MLACKFTVGKNKFSQSEARIYVMCQKKWNRDHWILLSEEVMALKELLLAAEVDASIIKMVTDGEMSGQEEEEDSDWYVWAIAILSEIIIFTQDNYTWDVR